MLVLNDSSAWGFFSDVDIESESMRWAGGLRFTLQAIVRILFLRRYKAKLRFRPLPEDDAVAGAAGVAAVVKGAGAGVLVPGRPGWREISGDVQGMWALNVVWGRG